VEKAPYRISVRGLLSDRLEAAFSEMSLERGDGETAIVGEVRDQAQLYGILDRIRSLGLELICVRRGRNPAS
jgi:hypothetical protein